MVTFGIGCVFNAVYYLLPSVLFCAVASLVNTHFLKINESLFVLCLYVSCIVLHLQQKQQLKTTIMTLTETLTIETQELKSSYIQKTTEWASDNFTRLKKFVSDYNENYDVSKEKYYYSLPACIINSKGKVEDYVSMQVVKAENHYTNSIEKLALRIEAKGLNLDNLKLSTSYLDPNISTTITDGKKTVSAYTIIASGMVQRPHYRYLIK